MAVKAADPGALELDEAFRAAMDGPAKPREAAPPPESERDAPFGRDDAGSPIAPYGHLKDGRPRLGNRGRRPADEKPRLATGPGDVDKTPVKAAKAAGSDADFSEPLSELADAIWLGMTGLSMIGSQIPLVGRLVPEDKLSAEAAIFRAHQAALCGAVSLAAKHNATAARLCAKLSGGGPTWVAMCGFMVMPFFVHTAAVLKGDAALESTGLPSVADLAESNKAQMAKFMTDMSSAAQASQDAAAAAVNGQVQAADA